MFGARQEFISANLIPLARHELLYTTLCATRSDDLKLNLVHFSMRLIYINMYARVSKRFVAFLGSLFFFLWTIGLPHISPSTPSRVEIQRWKKVHAIRSCTHDPTSTERQHQRTRTICLCVVGVRSTLWQFIRERVLKHLKKGYISCSYVYILCRSFTALMDARTCSHELRRHAGCVGLCTHKIIIRLLRRMWSATYRVYTYIYMLDGNSSRSVGLRYYLNKYSHGYDWWCFTRMSALFYMQSVCVCILP